MIGVLATAGSAAVAGASLAVTWRLGPTLVRWDKDQYGEDRGRPQPATAESPDD